MLGTRLTCRPSVIAMAMVVASSSTAAVHADEGGVSYWLPGRFSSLAATPQVPGWSMAEVYYHTSVSAFGTAAAARALPDGCTMVIVNQNFVVQPAIGEKLSYEVPESFTPVALLLAAPETISVNPSVPATTMKELAALVKANPGKYNYASPGYGSSPHLASERLFKQSLGLDVVHVPFQGGPPAVTSTVAGHTQILHLTLPVVAPLVRDGKLRLLAVADAMRAPEFPDVPTLNEAGIPNHEVGFWDGIMLPRGTPDDIVERRHRQISEIVALPEVRDRLGALGYTLVNGSRTQFAAHLQSELAKWKAIVREGKIKIE